MASAAYKLEESGPALPRNSACAPTIQLATHDWRALDNPEFRARWDALANWASEPNPFFESWYLLPSLRALDPGGKVKILVAEMDGALAGIMPIARQANYYNHPLPHWRNWVHPNCFLGIPLVARHLENQFWQALFGWGDQAGGLPLFIHLAHIPLSGPLYLAMKSRLTGQQRAHALVYREDRAMLASALCPDAYLEQGLSGKKRKELRRQHRRLSEEGDLNIIRQSGAAGLDEWIAGFLALEASGWKGKAGSALACSPHTAQLFSDALHGAAACGRLQRLCLELDGQPIAMLANFLTPPGAFSYKTAFDETLARFSPGVLLQLENLALLLDPAILWCDSCASADHPMIDHLWRERRSIGRVNIAIGGAMRRSIFKSLARAEAGGKKGHLP